MPSSIQEMSTLRNNSLVLSKRMLKGELKSSITVVLSLSRLVSVVYNACHSCCSRSVAICLYCIAVLCVK